MVTAPIRPPSQVYIPRGPCPPGSPSSCSHSCEQSTFRGAGPQRLPCCLDLPLRAPGKVQAAAGQLQEAWRWGKRASEFCTPALCLHPRGPCMLSLLGISRDPSRIGTRAATSRGRESLLIRSTSQVREGLGLLCRSLAEVGVNILALLCG